MSGSTIGGFIGLGIGTFFGVPQIGFALGSALGGYLKPEVINGPKIGDAKDQTSSPGVPRPVPYGHPPPFAGNLIDGERKARKVIKKTRQGKGGPVVKEEHFYLTSAFRVCEGPIEGYVRIWEDGVCVYDARTEFPDGWEGYSDEIRARQAKFLKSTRLYYGTEDQLPDPALEAIHGVGNTPYYRGTAYIVRENVDRTSTGGTAGQMMFEVTVCGTRSEGSPAPTFLVYTSEFNGPTSAMTVSATNKAPNFASDNSPPSVSLNGLVMAGEKPSTNELGIWRWDGDQYVLMTITGATPAPSVFAIDGTAVSNSGNVVILCSTDSELIYVYLYDGVGYTLSNSYAFEHIGPIGVCFSPDEFRVAIVGGKLGDYGLCTYRFNPYAGTLVLENDVSEAFPGHRRVDWMGNYIYTSENVGTQVGRLYRANDLVLLASSAAGVDDSPGFFDRLALVIYQGNKVLEVPTLAVLATNTPLGSGALVDLVISKGRGQLFYQAPSGGANVSTMWDIDGATVTLNTAQTWPRNDDFAAAFTGWNDAYQGNIPDAPGSFYDDVTGTVYTPGANYITVEACEGVSLGDVVQDIAQRCGVPAARIDTAEIDAIELPGFLVAGQDKGLEVLAPLERCYFYDLPDVDNGVLARVRGGAVVRSIPDDGVLESTKDDPIVRNQEIEFPAKVTVFTQEPEADYAAIPQTSNRASLEVQATGELSTQLPVPLDADETMQRAVILHRMAWTRAEGRLELDLPDDYCDLIVSDPIEYAGRRWLIEEADYADGELNIKATGERANDYISTATGQAPAPTLPPGGTIAGPTKFVAMNLPQLRDQDSVPGMYLGAQGVLAAWPGADIYASYDLGETYTLVTTITQASIMGVLIEDEDTSQVLVVHLYDPDDELESASDEAVAAGANAAALLDSDDVAEVISYRDAVEDTDGNWEISDLDRGVLDTTEVPRVAGDRFVNLDAVYFLPIDPAFDGQVIYFRAVTIGTELDANPITTAVFHAWDYVEDGGEVT